MRGRRAMERASERRSGPVNLRNSVGGLSAAFYAQQVIDPGFADAGSHTLGGAGIGTSAVAGGVLQITSINADYTAVPATKLSPLPAGTYTVTFTVGSYVSGEISPAASATADLASPTDGSSRSADGTYTEDLVLTTPGYIGLRGQGAAVVNSMQIDNLTIVRV